MNHQHHMEHCQTLAQEAKTSGEAPVGALLVHNETVIGKGRESTRSSKDVTDHAEIIAIRNAIALGHLGLLKKATLYSTHEPCFMCSCVIRHHRIPTVVFQNKVPAVGGVHSEFKVLLSASNPRWGDPPRIITLP